MTPFDPLNLTPPASLNRVRVIHVPGIALPNDVQGRTGYELLSRDALIGELVAHAAVLGLDTTTPATLPLQFGGCFTTDDPTVLAAAHDIGRRWGERLATLIRILKHGDAIQRAARPEWDASYWQHWGSVEHFWLGGGLIAGTFGQHVVHEAQTFLERAERCDVMLHRSANPQVLPLLGAARSVPPDIDTAIVLDFGGTEVKRAVPRFDSQRLAGLRLLPSLPVPLGEGGTSGDLTRQFIADAISTTLQASAIHSSRVHVEASISGYTTNNHLLPGQGGRYIDMDEGGVDGAEMIAREVGQQTGISITLRFVHDGTAAARVFAGAPRTSVIMLGTALGSGHAPPAATYRPMSTNTVIETF